MEVAVAAVATAAAGLELALAAIDELEVQRQQQTRRASLAALPMRREAQQWREASTRCLQSSQQCSLQGW